MYFLQDGIGVKETSEKENGFLWNIGWKNS
jgi:hypothetical protein